MKNRDQGVFFCSPPVFRSASLFTSAKLLTVNSLSSLLNRQKCTCCSSEKILLCLCFSSLGPLFLSANFISFSVLMTLLLMVSKPSWSTHFAPAKRTSSFSLAQVGILVIYLNQTVSSFTSILLLRYEVFRSRFISPENLGVALAIGSVVRTRIIFIS